MEGVNILSSEVFYNPIIPSFFAFIGGVITIICIIGGFAYIDKKSFPVFIAGLFTGLTLFSLGIIPNKSSISYIEHKATIDDSVSVNEFNEKYEIIDKDGKLYTIRERVDKANQKWLAFLNYE